MLPLRFLKGDTKHDIVGKGAKTPYDCAIAIGDLVKSTLGPKGMDKVIVIGKQISNDGSTILKSIVADNHAAKILVSNGLKHYDSVGDGTTSVTVLASELLREAEKLIDMHLHPQTIISGYRIALEIAKKALFDASTNTSKDDLLRIARTTLSSKILSQHKEHFSKLAVDAVMHLQFSRGLDAVQIVKKLGASLENSYLDKGFLLEKKPGMYQPQCVENAKILIADTAMDTDKVKVSASKARVDFAAKVAEIEAAEKKKMKDKVNKIISHDINVFINSQLIDNYPEQLFAEAKIMTIEHADVEGIERLALVLGGEIVSSFDTPEAVKFGKCDLIEKVNIGEDKFFRFSGVQKGEACSIVLRGATQQILDEAERAIRDTICVLTTHARDARTVPGAGASEALMAAAVLTEAQKVARKEWVAVSAFGRALLQLPTIICDNAGFDSAQITSQILAEHAKGNHKMGIDIENGKMADVYEMEILESFTVKYCMLKNAAEAAELILRVDDVIKTAPVKVVNDSKNFGSLITNVRCLVSGVGHCFVYGAYRDGETVDIISIGVTCVGVCLMLAGTIKS